MPDKLTTKDKVEVLESKVEEMEKHFFAFIKGMDEQTEKLNNRKATEEREWRNRTLKNQDMAREHSRAVKTLFAIDVAAMCCIAMLLAIHLFV